MPPKLGILAGGGDLPARLIEACRAAGRGFFVIAFDDQTEPETVAGAPHAWVALGAAGTTLKQLGAAGVEEVVFAGSIRRPALSALKPDLRGARILARARSLGDDALLKALVAELEGEGFRVVAPETVLPGILAEPGAYGRHRPDETAEGDIRRGIEVARGIGALDVGQAAVVQQGLVLAVEAADGTDAMLARVRDMAREGPGGVLVKVRKPGQEARADLPAIGPATVRAAAGAGLRGIAIEAAGALVIDRAQVVAAADEAGLFVVGVPVGEDPPP
jgi:DUF1009 family protein